MRCGWAPSLRFHETERIINHNQTEAHQGLRSVRGAAGGGRWRGPERLAALPPVPRVAAYVRRQAGVLQRQDSQARRCPPIAAFTRRARSYPLDEAGACAVCLACRVRFEWCMYAVR